MCPAQDHYLLAVHTRQIVATKWKRFISVFLLFRYIISDKFNLNFITKIHIKLNRIISLSQGLVGRSFSCLFRSTSTKSPQTSWIQPWTLGNTIIQLWNTVNVLDADQICKLLESETIPRKNQKITKINEKIPDELKSKVSLRIGVEEAPALLSLLRHSMKDQKSSILNENFRNSMLNFPGKYKINIWIN